MSSYLTHLALSETDIQRRVSTLAIPALTTRGLEEYAKSEQERDRVQLMIHHCKYHDTVLLQHVDARVGMYASPTGYVAVMHEDTTFRVDMLDRQLFRNVCICDLKRTKYFTDLEIQQNLVRWNQCIRDQSPEPWTSPIAPWVPSLGSFAWVGVYKRRGGGDGGGEYSLISITTMDDVVYDRLYDHAVKEWDGQISVTEAIERLGVYRDYSQRNGRRVLARALNLIGEETTETSAAPDVVHERYVSTNMSVPSSLWNWLPPAPIKIPLGYMVPRTTPRDVPPIPSGCASFLVGACLSEEQVDERSERTHPEILPEYQLIVDDFKPYVPYQVPGALPGSAKTLAEKERIRRVESKKRHEETKQVARYAGCGDQSDTASVYLAGPLQPIWVTPHHDVSPATYNAYAAQTKQGLDLDGTLDQVCVPHTWEDSSLVVNRLAQATFTPHDRVDAAVTYQPLFVRISCKDMHGLVRETPDRKRMNGFCAQDWTGL